MWTRTDYEEDDFDDPHGSTGQRLEEYSRYFSNELVTLFQRELSSLPESELNGSMRDRILQIVTRVVPQVHQSYQSTNGIVSKTADVGPSSGISQSDPLLQWDFSLHETSVANSQPPNALGPVASMPGTNNMADAEFLREIDNAQYLQFY